jgi:hypothetical protein
MTTTFWAVLALSGSLVPAATSEFQAQTDYGRALKLAQTEKKPMAVLIGKGDAFAKLMSDKNLTAEAKKLLSEKYVCVAVNTDTTSGKDLAGQFALSDGGLVISSAGGTHQALRQSGSVTAAELSKHVAAYATATGVPSATVTAGVETAKPATTYAPSSSVTPASYGAPSYGTPSFAPSFGNSPFGSPAFRSAAPGCTSFG